MPVAVGRELKGAFGERQQRRGIRTIEKPAMMKGFDVSFPRRRRAPASRSVRVTRMQKARIARMVAKSLAVIPCVRTSFLASQLSSFAGDTYLTTGRAWRRPRGRSPRGYGPRLRALDGRGARPNDRIAIKHRTCGVDRGAQGAPLGIIGARDERLGRAPHVADGGHAVGDIERAIVGVLQVHVHVDQARHQPFAMAIEAGDAVRNGRARRSRSPARWLIGAPDRPRSPQLPRSSSNVEISRGSG